MKNIIIVSLISIFAIGMFSSCNKNKTYAQNLKQEKKDIERFIDKEGIKVLLEYPKDSVFKANEFFFDKTTGIYYNVIEPGNSRRIEGGEEFYLRFKGLRYIYDTDTSTYSNINNNLPEILVYGNSSTYKSVAWVAPLKNIGDRGKVKMIVPFKMGLVNDLNDYKTAYYEQIDYRFELE